MFGDILRHFCEKKDRATLGRVFKSEEVMEIIFFHHFSTIVSTENYSRDIIRRLKCNQRNDCRILEAAENRVKRSDVENLSAHETSETTVA